MNKKAVNRGGICGASDQATGDSVLSSWLPVAFKNERTSQGSQMSSLDSNMAYLHWQQYLRHHSGTNTWGIHFPSWGGWQLSCVQKAGQLLTWTLRTCILIRLKRECEERENHSSVWFEIRLTLLTLLSFGERLTTVSCAMTSLQSITNDQNAGTSLSLQANLGKNQWKNSSSRRLRLCLIKGKLLLTAPGAFRRCLPPGRNE